MSTAISKPQSQLTTVKAWINSPDFREAIARALPKHMSPDRFLRVAITATMKNPKLLDCTQVSIFNCLLQLSQYGLEPDGRAAHLIPYKSECTLVIDYKGLAELVMRSGVVSSIHADVICENDEFDYNLGEIITHKIDFRKPRGDAYAAYVILKLRDGGTKTEVIPKAEIYAIRDKSQGWRAFKAGKVSQSVWDPKEPGIEREMWKKTAFRRASKWVPLSAEIRDVMQQEDADETTHQPEQRTVLIAEGQTKSDLLAELLAQKTESRDLQDEAQQRREEIEDQEPEKQPVTSTLRECDTMLQSAGINSTDAESPLGPFTYTLPDGMILKIGNGLDEAKSKKGLTILDAMNPEAPQIVGEMIDEMAKVVKK